ncbi:MAG: hypothetical protein AAGJ81_08335 [Verrucomicrobiota bacterium]
MKSLVLLFFAATALTGQTATKVATSNESIESGGPSGTPWFHNAQTLGTFQEYGISSFAFVPTDFGFPTVTGISAIKISYLKNGASFTKDGPVEFFITFDTKIASGNFSGLTHNGLAAGIEDTQFSDTPTLQTVGTGSFVESAGGLVDTYPLTLSPELETSLVSAINGGEPFAVILGAPSGNTSATYAGLESNLFESRGGSQPDSNRTSLTITASGE